MSYLSSDANSSGGGNIIIGTTTITGGADTQVLFNDGGFVGSDAGFTYVKGTDTLTIAGGINTLVVTSPTYLTLTSNDGGTKSVFLSNGAFTPALTNGQDLGTTAGAGFIWRTGYFGTSVVTPVVSSIGDTTLDVWTNGAVRWQFGRSVDGYALYPYLNNTYDLGYTGTNVLRTGYFGTSVVTPVIEAATATLDFKYSGTIPINFQLSDRRLRLSRTATIGWVNGEANSASPDVYLRGPAANTLEQWNSTNAQTFRVYSTDDGAGNAAWLSVSSESGPVFANAAIAEISTTKTGTGTQRQLAITGSALYLNAVGDVYIMRTNATKFGFLSTGFGPFGGDNTLDNGSATYKWRTGYFGTSVITPHLYAGTLTTADALADNYIATTATTQKGLVIQGKAGQSAHLQEWQSSAGAVLAYVNVDGSLLTSANVQVGNAVYFYNGSVLMYATAAVSDTGNAYTFADAGGTNLRQIKASSLLVRSTLTGTTVASINNTGLLDAYKSVATAGWGVPAIYGAGRATAQTAANASVSTYTVGAADGSFEVSANVLVTTSSAEAFTVTVDYTDEGNTARTATLNFQLIAGTVGTAINFANGAVPYAGIPIHIRCKASTAITVKTVGTFTGATYNVEGIIKQQA